MKPLRAWLQEQGFVAFGAHCFQDVEDINQGGIRVKFLGSLVELWCPSLKEHREVGEEEARQVVSRWLLTLGRHRGISEGT